MGERKVIEAEFRVVGEKPKREPFIGSWWGVASFVGFIGLLIAIRLLKQRYLW
jgi:hypothetical protein